MDPDILCGTKIDKKPKTPSGKQNNVSRFIFSQWSRLKSRKISVGRICSCSTGSRPKVNSQHHERSSLLVKKTAETLTASKSNTEHGTISNAIYVDQTNNTNLFASTEEQSIKILNDKTYPDSSSFSVLQEEETSENEEKNILRLNLNKGSKEYSSDCLEVKDIERSQYYDENLARMKSEKIEIVNSDYLNECSNSKNSLILGQVKVHNNNKSESEQNTKVKTNISNENQAQFSTQNDMERELEINLLPDCVEGICAFQKSIKDVNKDSSPRNGSNVCLNVKSLTNKCHAVCCSDLDDTSIKMSNLIEQPNEIYTITLDNCDNNFKETQLSKESHSTKSTVNTKTHVGLSGRKISERSSSSLDNILFDNNLDREFIKSIHNASKTRFETCFSQPGKKVHFHRSVMEGRVKLEYAKVDAMRGLLTGCVRVRSFGYEKKVTIRISFDNWENFCDVPAQYVQGSHDEFTDRFSFRILFPSTLVSGDYIYFAIKYQTDTGDHFWDNNEDKNYSVLCIA